MSLVARVSLTGPSAADPEDYLFSALSIIFPDDTTNQHGDADHGVLYTSPHLPEPLHLSLTDPTGESDRTLFSHYLWNASLLLAKLVEAGTLTGGRAGADIVALRGSGPLELRETEADTVESVFCSVAGEFDMTGLSSIELGAGTALPSILGALLGASRVAITDYPSAVVLDNLRANIARNVRRTESVGERAQEAEPAEAEGQSPSPGPITPKKNPVTQAAVTVDGHAWGVFDTDVAKQGHHAYDRVFVCDCLWMPWQHDNLRKSIDWFLSDGWEDSEGEKGSGISQVGGGGSGAKSSSLSLSSPRCWVVAGFHTGREKVAAFFDEDALADVNLEIEAIWERDCDDKERPWVRDRGIEDSTERKRWLVVGILRRRRRLGTSARS